MDKTNFSNRIKDSLKSFFYIGVGKSLLIWFLAISFIPLALVSVINYLYSHQGSVIMAEKALITTSQLRIDNIESYFEQKSDLLKTISEQEYFISLFERLKNDFDNKEDILGYIQSNTRLNVSESILSIYNFQKSNEQIKDLYLIDKDGNLLFNINEEINLGNNLFNTLAPNSLFKNLCKEVLNSSKVLFSDLEFYEPVNNQISGFFAKSILRNGEVIGIVALRISIEDINQILKNTAVLGNNGESYIVGSDLLFRSQSRFEDENTVLVKRANNEKTLKWLNYITHRNDDQYLALNDLNEEEILSYTNSRGSRVVGIYRNLFFLEKFGINWVLVDEMEQADAFESANLISDIAKYSFIITVIVVFFVSIFVTRRFVNPIKKLSAWAKQVAKGELDPQEVRAPRNEVGEMVNTFNSLVTSLRAYANVSEAAAFGDYSKVVEIRSKKDVLGKSMNTMVISFKEVVRQANKIAQGDYSADIVPRSDKDTLGISLFEMTKQLRISSSEIFDQDWHKSGINKIENILSGQENIKTLTDEVLRFLIEYLEAQIGLLYIRDGNSLILTSTYSFKKSDKTFKKIEIGDGIIGQVAKDQKVQSFNEENIDLPKLNLVVSENPPSFFVVAPVIFEGVSKGVIMLGSATAFSVLKSEFFKTCLDSIAVAVNSVQARVKVELLLKQTQDLANELTVQQEELRQSNDELEEQTKALKLSEENLKNQQEELKVTNEELEERTNDLEIQRDNIRNKNKELRVAQDEIEQKAKDLEKASKYKSEFLANMSHELRTPLNSILVLSQLLSANKNEHLNAKEIEFAKTINSSGVDLLDLINEILDLSKVESGKIDLQVEDMHFTDLTAFISRTFTPLTDKKKLSLITKIDKGLPGYVKTDIQRVYQVLKNLFSNAIKFTTKGSITLKIHRPDAKFTLEKSGLNSKKAIAFSVIDTGIGIPDDKLELIFEAFKQADGTTSRKFGGTGLGLTISRSFSAVLGGEILLESEYGKGSTFTLVLPELFDESKIEKVIESQESIDSAKVIKKASPLQKAVTLKEPAFKDDRGTIQAGDKFILIIEDDENFSKVLYEIAHDRGFKCMVALDGESGLHFADYYQPSAIILDIGLPGIDGYEVMERLKDNTKTRHIPVHIISAADKSLKAMKMGAIGYLTKPVSNKKLDEAFKKIETLVSKPIKKVLVVEDDTIMSKRIVKLLSDDGNVKITVIESGEAAYNLLRKEQFDCQILDLGLKDMSGFELLEKIRKDKKIVDLPIIIYTGKELSKVDETKLNKYANSIILKGARSFERLLSETTLFLHQLETDMPEDKRKMLLALHNKESALEGKKILLVDDDMRNVFALSSLLEEKGIKVIVGKNGIEGLSRLEENSDIDLVLMDIMMPEMDGYEATREIRKQKKYKKLPIIALTAKAMKEDREKCIAAGANDYLAKPVDSEKLLSLLRVWLYSK